MTELRNSWLEFDRQTAARLLTPGAWATLAALLSLLVCAIVIAILGWKLAGHTDVPPSGYVALALGVIFSLVVGIGLMALVFYSSRAGFDEPVKLIEADKHEPE